MGDQAANHSRKAFVAVKLLKEFEELEGIEPFEYATDGGKQAGERYLKARCRLFEE